MAVERHTGGKRARAAALEAIALKRNCLDATGRLSPALADPRFAAFFADAAEGRGRPAGCGVSVLNSNGETAGIAIDVTCGRRRAAHVIVHDPRLDAFSPGTLLLQEWIRGAGADAIATFDLLAPAYAYKLDWADETVAVEDFALGLTLAGRAYAHVYLALRPWLKAAAEAAWHRARSLSPFFMGSRDRVRGGQHAPPLEFAAAPHPDPLPRERGEGGPSASTTAITQFTPRRASSAGDEDDVVYWNSSFLPG